MDGRPPAGSWSVAELTDELVRRHPGIVGRRADVRVVRAPGRVNLIGEYTDFNDGFVLPAAIDLEIRIAYVPVRDRRVTLTRLDDGATDAFDLDRERAPTGSFLDYVAGTAWALAGLGHRPSGLVGVIATSLPPGAGLSSSAAIESSAAWAMLDDRAPDIDALDLARICQRAENGYVGVRSGLMDQFASACGVAGHALLLDCRSQAWTAVPLPPDIALVVCHTGAPRQLDGSAYNERRAQCEAAVAAVAAIDPTVRSLRDVTPDHLAATGDRLDPIARRRAEHVITENERVHQVVGALPRDDLSTIREAFADSHASLRDRFDVVTPELDAMVSIAMSTPGVIAARMTGAGFGGCTINLVHPDAVDALREAVETRYAVTTGLRPMILRVEAAAGAGRLDGEHAPADTPGTRAAR